MTLVLRIGCGVLFGLLAACGNDGAGAASTPPSAATSTTMSSSGVGAGTPATTAMATPTRNVAVAPLIVDEANLPYATEYKGFRSTLAATGGSGAYSWSLQSGSLPAGLTLSSSGSLSGTPTTVGIFPFTARVVDVDTPQHTASRAYNLIVSGMGTTTEVTLAKASSDISIDSAFAGLSYEKQEMTLPLFSPDNSTLIALFSRLGAGLLRIGGNSVDHTVWSATGHGEKANQVAPPDVDRLAGFLKACKWRVIYGIEFLNEETSPATKADPNLVAAEAVYAMQSLGDSLFAFELGNEPDRYVTEIRDYRYSTFQFDWKIYRNAILAAVEAAKAAGTLPQSATPRFTGPDASYLESYITPFAESESDDVSVLTRHFYRANGQSAASTMSLLLEPDPDLPLELSAMATAATGNRIASGYRISEANSYYNGGAPGVSDAFGTALWAINFLFENAWAGSSGVNFHGGWTQSYTPIADNERAAVEVRPEYYGIDLFSQAANGKLIAATTTPASASLYAYAVGGAGTTHVILVNTSATTSHNAKIRFNRPVSSATYVTLTGPSLTATSGTLMNGKAILPDGSWPEAAPPPLAVTAGNLEVPVPAGSAILLNAQ